MHAARPYCWRRRWAPGNLVVIADAIAVFVKDADRDAILAHVARPGEGTAAIVHRGRFVEVAGGWVSAAQAGEEVARPVIIGGVRVEVAGGRVGAPWHLFVIADAVRIHIGGAIAAAFSRGVRDVAVAIACALRKGRTPAFEHGAGTVANATFIHGADAGVVALADAIAVGVEDAVSVAVLSKFRVEAPTIVHLGFGVVVARQRVDAPEVETGAVILVGLRVVVVSFLIGAPEDFFLVADAIPIGRRR